MDTTKNDATNTPETDKPCCNCCDAPQETKNPFVETMKDGMSKVFSGAKACAIALIAALVIVVTGCKSIPTVEKMETTARLVGTSAGMVVNMTKIDEKSKTVVVEIMKIVETSVPQTNQTFTEAWTPIAKEHVTKLIQDGKIDAGQGELILTGFNLACEGLDYVFEVRYPKARTYKELVEAAVHGFIGGFTSVVNGVSLKSTSDLSYDEKAFDYLKSKLN